MLYLVAEQKHVEYDSTNKQDGFIVWKRDGSSTKFKSGTRGLYYCDTEAITGTVLMMDDNNPDTVSQVKIKKRKYTETQIKDTLVA